MLCQLTKDKKTGKWFVFFYYRDWQGARTKEKQNEDFKPKREALEWEREFKQRQETNLDMSF